ncbi:hypothetical protein HK405_009910, partial [Cladochytrium tenue]
TSPPQSQPASVARPTPASGFGPRPVASASTLRSKQSSDGYSVDRGLPNSDEKSEVGLFAGAPTSGSLFYNPPVAFDVTDEKHSLREVWRAESKKSGALSRLPSSSGGSSSVGGGDAVLRRPTVAPRDLNNAIGAAELLRLNGFSASTVERVRKAGLTVAGLVELLAAAVEGRSVEARNMLDNLVERSELARLEVVVRVVQSTGRRGGGASSTASVVAVEDGLPVYEP